MFLLKYDYSHSDTHTYVSLLMFLLQSCYSGNKDWKHHRSHGGQSVASWTKAETEARPRQSERRGPVAGPGSVSRPLALWQDVWLLRGHASPYLRPRGGAPEAPQQVTLCEYTYAVGVTVEIKKKNTFNSFQLCLKLPELNLKLVFYLLELDTRKSLIYFCQNDIFIRTPAQWMSMWLETWIMQQAHWYKTSLITFSDQVLLTWRASFKKNPAFYNLSMETIVHANNSTYIKNKVPSDKYIFIWV